MTAKYRVKMRYELISKFLRNTMIMRYTIKSMPLRRTLRLKLLKSPCKNLAVKIRYVYYTCLRRVRFEIEIRNVCHRNPQKCQTKKSAATRHIYKI